MRILVLIAAVALTADAAAAQERDSAVYVVRLGVDTVAVERWVRSPDSLHVVAVTRSPRTVVRRYVARFDSAGRVRSFSTGPQGPQPVETGGAVPVVGGTYAPYAIAVWYAMRAGTPETVVPMRIGSGTRDVTVQRRAATEYTLPNQFDVPLSVIVEADGGVVSIDAGGGSTVERTAWFDIEALTREFAARDAAGTGLGPLSPRDTARATVGRANVMIDYSRPSARGRTVMGGLVPYDQVWRTGANDATQLITDAPLRIGDLRLEPGRYSLFTIPRADAWDLIVNRQVGMSGLDYDPAQDVGRVRMQASPAPAHTEQLTIRIEGGRLFIEWGEASMWVGIEGQG
ncbi:MAG TPA: DUF2911 domain-containing protein [Longimicrobiales bacterium]